MKRTIGNAMPVALALALLGGCASKTVNDVLADPAKYRNKEVSITGDVVESVSITGRGFYQIEDATGRLWVFSDKGVPRKGARVKVKGTVRDGFDLGPFVGVLDLPEAIKERVESGLLLVESSHQAAN